MSIVRLGGGGGGGGGVCVWGGERVAAVTFLCDTWKNSMFLQKSFGLFGNILERK